MVNRHVTKMLLETTQILSTAHRILDGTEYSELKNKRKIKRWKLPDFREDILYKATHVNHPSCVWARESVSNYIWLLEHLEELCLEYSYRYNKVHKCEKIQLNALLSPPNIKPGGLTPIKLAMPEKYMISSDPVECYREYYRNGKQHLFEWKNRERPIWL